MLLTDPCLLLSHLCIVGIWLSALRLLQAAVCCWQQNGQQQHYDRPKKTCVLEILFTTVTVVTVS